jgi:hypothetical protein
MTKQTFTGTLEVVTCAGCAMTFGIPVHLATDRRTDHKTFYCPNGHSNYWPQESDLERTERFLTNARERTRYAEAAASAARDQAAAAARSNRALKGHLTRARNKIAAGNCPVPDCGQHFANVREHMKFKHPEFHLIDPDTGKVAEL